MGHIISQQKDFAFVHNPKVGGSSVRHQVDRYNDARDVFSGKMRVIAGYGTVDMGHITLPAIKRFFPDQFAEIRSRPSFALVRDSVQRFGSALAEHVSRFRAGNIFDYTAEERRSLIDEVRVGIQLRPECAPAEYCHFSRQVDFVDADGDRIVQHVYPLEEVDAAFAHMGEVAGVRLKAGTRNQSMITDRPGARSKRRRGLRRVLDVVAPEKSVDDWTMLPELSQGPVRDFIEDHYAADIALHASLLKARTGSAPHTQTTQALEGT